MALDKTQARELTLFIENDGTLYRQMAQPIVKNYALKKLKGTYKKALALRGILNLVEAGRRKYIRDFGSIGMVSGDTKMETAKGLYDWINEESTYEARKIRKQKAATSKLKTLRKKK